MGLFWKSKKEKEQEAKEKVLEGTLSQFPFFMAIKPKESYIFRSNDYESDGKFGTILNFFHLDGGIDNFGTFWGIDLIPVGLDDDIAVTVVQTVERLSDSWVSNHQTNAENIAEMNSNEQAGQTSKTNKAKASKREEDLDIIAQELQAGAAYMQCMFRLQIQAPSQEKLDEALLKIETIYKERFKTLYATSYSGEQKGELASLLRPIALKKGTPFQLTSTELAGQYNMVTRGIEDEWGDYVGKMYGDVNTAAILFDVDGYTHHTVVCSEQYDESRIFGGRTHVSDIWGSKISQACLMNNHRVAHIILDNCNLDRLGPKFASITRKLDMNTGDVNMFEIFGSEEDELMLFPMQMRKLVLMADQIIHPTDSDKSIINGSLEKIVTKYYVDNRMWHENAAQNRSKLRTVGIPHKDVPKLEMFVAYLETEHKKLVNASSKDPEELHAFSVLKTAFNNILSNNGDLFNTTTNPIVDDMVGARRTIYDFSQLSVRDSGIMMAQLLNIISFCTGNLGRGDTLIIHGAEKIVDEDGEVKRFLSSVFQQLYTKGGRVAFLYNDNECMFNDVAFSGMDSADYTIMGTMTDNGVSHYQDVLGQTIPSNLVGLIASKNDRLTFIHRDYNNVVFNRDLVLFPRRVVEDRKDDDGVA